MKKGMTKCAARALVKVLTGKELTEREKTALIRDYIKFQYEEK
jgi:hypothetical protein